MARNYMNWQAGVRGKPRRREDVRLSVLFGLGQRLRCGATTVIEVGAGGDPARFVSLVDELGIRAYTGPSYRNVILFSHDDGRLDYDWDDERGEKGLRAGLQFAEQYDGAAGGRLKAMLCPGHTDTCSDTLLWPRPPASRAAQPARDHPRCHPRPGDGAHVRALPRDAHPVACARRAPDAHSDPEPRALPGGP